MDNRKMPKPKILMVDDEPDNLDLLYRTFRHEYRVLRSTSGPEALDLLSREPDVALVISDQRMPHMSGTEFLSLTASQYPDIIRIILTGYTDVDDLVEAINAGQVFQYVTKPWDEEELRTVVQRAVETHKILKARTQDLRRSLRQESLLNAIATALRSALDYRQLLQTLVETMGEMFEVDLTLLRLLQAGQFTEEDFSHLGSHHNGNLSQEIEVAELSRTVWETETVQVITDVAENSLLQAMVTETESLADLYQRFAIRSSLLVPIIYQQELQAILALHQCEQAREWPEEDIHLVALVADQAAPAIAQALAYDRIRTLAQQQALVNTITSAIRSSLDPQAIFAAITHQLGEALRVDSCALSLWTARDEYVHCVGLYRINETLENLDLPQSYSPIQGNPVLTRLLKTAQPVVIDNLREHPETTAQMLSVEPPTQSLLVVPLIADELIGSISLRQVEYARQWKPSEIQLAQIVASQAAIAVQQSRLYETTRQQAEQLLELDRQKTEFFQNVSHEFRTPLTLTIGPLESVVSQDQGLSYDQSVIALRHSRRLLRLVNQLLDLQRLDAGRMQPHFRPVEIEDFLSQIVESFRPYCERKGLQLQASLTTPVTVYLDTEKFDKVIYNLLSNAMKFTPKGGRIEVGLEQQDDRCQVHVKDSGIGIREDQLPYLFERFRQAEGSASRSYEGSGLGLALVKRLVELHGGQVQVESVYGTGSTFKVDLPLGKEHLPANCVTEVKAGVEISRAVVELGDLEARVGEGEAGSEIVPDLETEASDRPLILVVDDNSDLRDYLAQILRNAGYRICAARQGQEGFELAQKYYPALIVTDLMMPVVSGLDLIQKIRANERLQGIPVVLLTAKADEDTRITSAEQGADAYLSKPFNDRELIAEVRNLLALKANERRVAELNVYLTETVLGRFLPPAMVKKAAAGELTLELQPEPRLVTIVFTDIVDFTPLSSRLQARRIAQLLNEYLGEMSQVIFANGGTVDKFMGDAILCFFGAPEELSPQLQASRAVTTARPMLHALANLNHEWSKQGLEPVQVRCGIHQGEAVVGLFGSTERSDYTAIGPTVNIAARLQEAAQPGTILVSSTVAQFLDPNEVISVGFSNLKGVTEEVPSFVVKA
jgi:adenylate cyclase